MKTGRLLLACGLAASLLTPGIAEARVLVDKKAEVMALADSALQTPQSNGFVWPIEGNITTYFNGGHAGIDIDALHGDRIVAAQSGTVTFAGDDGDGYGTKVIIRHVGGYETLYSHLSSIAATRGPISQGDYVGGVGCTGSCTGDHLHFEILRHGTVTDPLDLLPQ